MNGGIMTTVVKWQKINLILKKNYFEILGVCLHVTIHMDILKGHFHKILNYKNYIALNFPLYATAYDFSINFSLICL
jgi:hypothetical protein